MAELEWAEDVFGGGNDHTFWFTEVAVGKINQAGTTEEVVGVFVFYKTGIAGVFFGTWDGDDDGF